MDPVGIRRLLAIEQSAKVARDEAAGNILGSGEYGLPVHDVEKEKVFAGKAVAPFAEAGPVQPFDSFRSEIIAI